MRAVPQPRCRGTVHSASSRPPATSSLSAEPSSPPSRRGHRTCSRGASPPDDVKDDNGRCTALQTHLNRLMTDNKIRSRLSSRLSVRAHLGVESEVLYESDEERRRPVGGAIYEDVLGDGGALLVKTAREDGAVDGLLGHRPVRRPLTSCRHHINVR